MLRLVQRAYCAIATLYHSRPLPSNAPLWRAGGARPRACSIPAGCWLRNLGATRPWKLVQRCAVHWSAAKPPMSWRTPAPKDSCRSDGSATMELSYTRRPGQWPTIPNALPLQTEGTWDRRSSATPSTHAPNQGSRDSLMSIPRGVKHLSISKR